MSKYDLDKARRAFQAHFNGEANSTCLPLVKVIVCGMGSIVNGEFFRVDELPSGEPAYFHAAAHYEFFSWNMPDYDDWDHHSESNTVLIDKDRIRIIHRQPDWFDWDDAPIYTPESEWQPIRPCDKKVVEAAIRKFICELINGCE